MVFVLILRSPFKLNHDKLLVLYAVDKANNINDKKVGITLEDRPLCGVFCFFYHKKHLCRSLVFDVTFKQFITINTEQLPLDNEIVRIK
jgi:hypothetical protein